MQQPSTNAAMKVVLDTDDCSSGDESSDSSSGVTVVHRLSNEDKIARSNAEIASRVRQIEDRMDQLSADLKKSFDAVSSVNAALNRDIVDLRTGVNAATGRSRSVLLLNVPEENLRGARQRRSREVAFLQSVFRAARLPPATHWKKVHRVGKWAGCAPAPPRPLVVEFLNQRDRDLLLSRKKEVQFALAGNVTVVPDNRWAAASSLPTAKGGIAPQVSVVAHRMGVPSTPLQRSQPQSPLDRPRHLPSPFLTPKAVSVGTPKPVSPLGRPTYAQVAATPVTVSPHVDRAVQATAAPRKRGPKKGLVPRTALTRD